MYLEGVSDVATKNTQTPVGAPTKGRKALVYLSRYWQLYAMLAIPMVYFLIFKYLPMEYIVLAWKKYTFNTKLWDMEWVGWKHFIKAFNLNAADWGQESVIESLKAIFRGDFWLAVRNTIMLNLLDLFIGFPVPIIFALVLNELKLKRFKKVVQTVAYMPHFLSWVIIYSLSLQIFATSDGFINQLIGWGVQLFTGNKFDGIRFLSDPKLWVCVYILVGIWQSFGWNSIIYLAAITGISPELYEAASVDGANRLQKMIHITLPGIRPTIVVLLIMAIGNIVGSGFDRPFAMRNNDVMDVANVISTFVYTRGILNSQFELSTAVGLFQSVIGVIFLLGSNWFSKKMGDRGIF